MHREARSSTPSHSLAFCRPLRLLIVMLLVLLMMMGPLRSHGAVAAEPVTSSGGNGVDVGSLDVGSSSSATLCAFVQQQSVVVAAERSSSHPPQPSSSAPSAAPLLPQVLADNRTVRCAKASDKCYALWSKDPNNQSALTIIAQGCWEASGKCSQSECVVEGTPSKARNNTKFCCCAGNMCNVNIRDETPPLTNSSLIDHLGASGGAGGEGEGLGPGGLGRVVTLVSGAAVLFLLLLVLSWLGLRWRRKGGGAGGGGHGADAVHLMEATPPPPPSPSLDLQKLKLVELLDQGCYGRVWRGTLEEKEVAAKVFSHQHRAYYLNEKDIYGLAFMDHPAITRFIGADERLDPASGKPFEYLIVMAHAPHGCLQDYLRRHTVDWTTLCRMTSSVAKGLAHMHTDIRKGSQMKPCISHRDVNSRNVLVKADLSCALCDMGFAMKIAGSKYYGQNGEEQHAETTSLTDVGTLRYMAPEVLEGAVNLRDCESSLKQIDVYAMGLVLWEVATRCADLYQGTEVLDYKLPFQNEIGPHPTFEQMQVLVSRNKARPLFPEVFKDTNLAIRLLKETIEDCWDQDAEARLTSLCVEERLHELPNLWDRHKANLGVVGVSPTLNPSAIYNHNQSAHLLLSIPGSGNESEVTDRNANIVSLNDVILPRARVSSSSRANADSSVSEQTEDTLLSPSSSLDGAAPFPTSAPASPPPPLPPPLPEVLLAKNSANNNRNNVRHNRALQPHQGRNPCLERNMIMEPLEEVTVSGNRLLDKRHNRKSPPPPASRNHHRGQLSPDHTLYDVLSLVDSADNNALVSADVLGHATNQRSSNSSSSYHHPIPYLQNAVHSSFPVCPKQPNVPGNGHSHCQSLSNHNNNNAKQPKSRGLRWPSSGSGHHHHRKVKDWVSFRSLLLDWTRLNSNSSSSSSSSAAANNHEEQLRKQRTRMDILNSEKSNLLGHANVSSAPPPSNYNYNPPQQNGVSKVHTRVSLSNGHQQSAPLTMVTLVNRANPEMKETEIDVAEEASSPEVGVARLHVPNGSTPIHVVQSRSRSAQQSLPLPPPQRPNSLPVQTYRGGAKGHREGAVTSVDNLVKVEQRVKTPFKLKSNRLSLCDDRMMTTGSEGGTGSTHGVPRKYSISVPHDIASLNDVSETTSGSRQSSLPPPLLSLPSTSVAQQQQLVNEANAYQVSCI